MSPPALARAPDSTAPHGFSRLLAPLVFAPLQFLLGRIVRRVAARRPAIMERLGPHKATRFLIDPVDMPFALLLRPDPARLELRAVLRADMPAHDARIAGRFLRLLRLVDCDEDGDAMFFSRDLDIGGDVEAVVTLRNALDDIDGSLAADVAAMFGRPGEAALGALRRHGGWRGRDTKASS